MTPEEREAIINHIIDGLAELGLIAIKDEVEQDDKRKDDVNMINKNIDDAYDTLCLEIENSLALIDAIRTMGNMDMIIDSSIMGDPELLKKTENWDKYVNITKITESHNTVSSLSWQLENSLSKMDKAINLLGNELAKVGKK